MPRRTRKQLVGRREDRLRREREREMEELAVALRREWHWLPRPDRETQGGVSEAKPPLPGRVIGYAVTVVVVAAAARLVWELLSPLVPVLLVLVALVGIFWLVVGRLRL